MTPQELIGELYDAVDNDDMYSRSYLVYAVEDLCTENAKLRELVRDMYKSMDMSCQFSHAIPPSTMAHIKNRAIGLEVDA